MGPEEVLGVRPGARPEELRRAYLRHVKAHHPDQGGDRGTFEAGVAAYRALARDGVPPAAPVEAYHRGVGAVAARLLVRTARRLGLVPARVR